MLQPGMGSCTLEKAHCYGKVAPEATSWHCCKEKIMGSDANGTHCVMIHGLCHAAHAQHDADGWGIDP